MYINIYITVLFSMIFHLFRLFPSFFGCYYGALWDLQCRNEHGIKHVSACINHSTGYSYSNLSYPSSHYAGKLCMRSLLCTFV